MIAVVAIAVALGLGWAGGGSVGGLATLRLRSEWLMISAFVLQGIARGRLPWTGETKWGYLVWVVTSFFIVGALVANWRIPGTALTAFGTGLNLAVVLVNGSMPVTVPSRLAGIVVERSIPSQGFYALGNPGSIALVLGDAIPMPLGGFAYYLSAGDLLLGVGIVIVVVASMLSGSQESDGAVGGPDPITET